MEQDVGVLQLHAHLLGVGNEVGREIAAVELHPFDDVEFRLEALALLDRDHAFVADTLHGLGELCADLGVAIGRDGADLRDLSVGGDLLGFGAQLLDGGGNRLVDTAPQVHRVRASRNRLRAFSDDRLGEHSGGRGAVAGKIGGLRGDLLEHLRAHVLELVFELNFLGDRHTILGNAGPSVGFVEHDIAALGAERDFDRVGENVDAAQHAIARVLTKFHVFRRHVRQLLKRGNGVVRS